MEKRENGADFLKYMGLLSDPALYPKGLSHNMWETAAKLLVRDKYGAYVTRESTNPFGSTKELGVPRGL